MSLELWTLGDIKTKIRNITGMKSVNQLSEANLLNYINRYYQIVFPLEVQPLELQTWFEFDITDGVDEYDLATQTDATTSEIFADGYLTIFPPFTLDGYNLFIYQNPELFYAKYPEINTYQETRPTDVLYYNESLTFRATPDTTYSVKFASIKKPSALAADGDYPIQEEWGPVISYGAAVEILEDSGDTEGLAVIGNRYETQKVILGRKSHDQDSYSRSIPTF